MPAQLLRSKMGFTSASDEHTVNNNRTIDFVHKRAGYDKKMLYWKKRLWSVYRVYFMWNRNLDFMTFQNISGVRI